MVCAACADAPPGMIGVLAPPTWAGHRRVMTMEPEPNVGTPSTTWEWRRVKMQRPPEAKERAERSESSSLLPWPRSKPVTVVLKYRGGPECWVEVRARGRIWRRPGHTAVYDLLTEVFGWRPR